jgi:hypothetical protein
MAEPKIQRLMRELFGHAQLFIAESRKQRIFDVEMGEVAAAVERFWRLADIGGASGSRR